MGFIIVTHDNKVWAKRQNWHGYALCPYDRKFAHRFDTDVAARAVLRGLNVNAWVEETPADEVRSSVRIQGKIGMVHVNGTFACWITPAEARPPIQTRLPLPLR